MSGTRKRLGYIRGTTFIVAQDMRTAERWAEAVGLSKDKYRYVAVPEVFDVMGPNDDYAYVAGADLHPRHVEFMAVIRTKSLEWCQKDPYALVRDPATGMPPRRDAPVAVEVNLP